MADMVMSVVFLVSVGVAAMLVRAKKRDSWFRWLVIAAATILAIASLFDHANRKMDLVFVLLALVLVFPPRFALKP
ncbi:MAG TPA: hypothetical protein VGM77_06270 [Gemmatimonadales bacterium]|jgi:hypothetical protein